MKNLLTLVNEEMTISHRIVAENTANQEVSIRKLIDKYISDFKEFGMLSFKMTKTTNTGLGNGRPSKTYFLNEQQAYLLMTYLANTDIVRNFKVALVKAFFEMRQELYHIASKSFQGKSVVHTINGLKSGLHTKDRRISLLENRVQELSTKNESLKVQNIKLYEESKESASSLNKIKNVLGIESLQLNPSEHNALLEIIYQMISFQNDLQEIEKVCKSRKESIDNYLKVFTKKYGRCENHINELQHKNIGALQSRFRF